MRYSTGIKPEHRAVIDVGTNSIKLLVADTAGGSVRPLLEAGAQQPIRLGRGFYPKRSLRRESIVAAAQAIAQLAKKSRDFSPLSIQTVATSAIREAHNREELVTAVRDACGLELEVISGDREAEWVFRGVASDPAFAGCPSVILDVGGGSTEIIVSNGAEVCFRRSFDLGAVRLMEHLQLRDPPTSTDRSRCEDFLAEFFGGLVTPVLTSSRYSRTEATHLIGTGGTAACLANMKAKGTESDWLVAQAAHIRRSELRAQLERLWKMTLSERKKIPGLPENRADIILTGAAIFEAAMTHFEFAELSVSRRGLRFGALLSVMESASQEANARTRRIHVGCTQ